jgi:hypothetical protein
MYWKLFRGKRLITNYNMIYKLTLKLCYPYTLKTHVTKMYINMF